MKTVLLTGVTGFVGSYTAIQLLNKGYKVIRTMRDLPRADEIRKTIGAHTHTACRTNPRVPIAIGIERGQPYRSHPRHLNQTCQQIKRHCLT